MLGVLAGSYCGAKILVRIHPRWLRILFSIVIVAIGIQMFYNGITGAV
jgi:uncharacterized membrane protein YfcA